MAGRVRFNMETKQVIRNLRIIKQSHQSIFAAAMHDEIDEFETPECQARTPIDTGDLVSTVQTAGPVIRGKTIFVGTTAGGAATSGKNVDYAIEVHENTEMPHRVGQAKFIESVYRESSPFILERVGRRVDLARILQRVR